MDAETQKKDTLYDFLAWLEVNKKRVIAGGVAAVLLGGVVMTVFWFNKQRELKASEALSSIRLPYSSTEAAPADTVDKLEKLAKDFSGTAAATRAELIRAGVLYTSGKYTEAQAGFEKFLRDHAESRWSSAAVYGIAVCLDAQGKTSEAIAKYEDFARRFGNDANIDQARLSLGTLYEGANKPAEALKEYEKIVKSMGYSPAFGEAQERQRLLLIKYPALAATNAPTAPKPPVSVPPVGVTNAASAVRTNGAAATNKPLIIKPTAVTPVPAAAKPTASPASPAPAGK